MEVPEGVQVLVGSRVEENVRLGDAERVRDTERRAVAVAVREEGLREAERTERVREKVLVGRGVAVAVHEALPEAVVGVRDGVADRRTEREREADGECEGVWVAVGARETVGVRERA